MILAERAGHDEPCVAMGKDPVPAGIERTAAQGCGAPVCWAIWLGSFDVNIYATPVLVDFAGTV
jgi:hypothetical protein